MSNMKDSPPNVNQRLAARVRELRASHHLSLDALAVKCGVSRSMLSRIERGESSPTAVILEKLAAGLHVTLAALFDALSATANTSRHPVARRPDQIEWKDPASGYVRRNVSPPGVAQPAQIVEVNFPAGARVAFESGARGVRVYQQIWVLQGAMNITVGHESHRLQAGDCLAMQLDRPTMFHNPTRKAARYAVVLSSENSRRR